MRMIGYGLGTALSVLSQADLKGAFSTALDTVKSDIMSYIGVALPVAIGVVGTVVAVKFGIKFFKGMAK